MSAAEIITTLGRGPAVILSRSLGGKFVYLPTTPEPDNPIAEVLGIDALNKLIDALGSGPLWIPAGIYRGERDRHIETLVERGISAKQIARALRISPRTVRHISRFTRMEQQIQRQAHEPQPTARSNGQ